MPNIGKLMIRHRDVCAYCGCTTQLRNRRLPTFATVDHLHPRSKGGRRSNGNSVLACQRCNGLKGNRRLEDIVAGWDGEALYYIADFDTTAVEEAALLEGPARITT